MTIAQTTILNHPDFQTHVIHAAGKAHACLPEDNGRIARAVDLVLGGCVVEEGEGRYAVASAARFPESWYTVHGSTCTCEDFVRHATTVPTWACKHRIATAIYRLAVQAIEKEEVMTTPQPDDDNGRCWMTPNTPLSTSINPDELPVQTVEEYFAPICWVAVDDQGTPCHAAGTPCPGHAAPALPLILNPWQHPLSAEASNVPAVATETTDVVNATPAAVSVPSLPEAPASANCFVLVNGHRVQVTLRDFDETRLMERMVKLLANYRIAPGK